MEKTGVYLTGGGARGAIHIGFFKALEEMGIRPDFVCGNSVGSLISAAQTYMDSYEMMDTWNKITVDKLLGFDSSKVIGLSIPERREIYKNNTRKILFGSGFLLNPDPTIELFYDLLNNFKIMYSNKDFGITTTRLSDMKFLKLYKDDLTVDNVIEYIIASIYLPVFRPRKLVDGRHYMDLSDARDYPLDMLKVKDCKKIYIVDTTNNMNKTIKMINRHELNMNDITIIPVETNVFMLDFTPDMNLKSFNDGYETSMKVLNKKCANK